MAGLGSIIGRKIGIRPQAKTDWTEYANQWALLIGRPGVLKSPAMEQALGPIRRLAAQAIETHRSEMRRYTADLKAAKENDEEPPEKPISSSGTSPTTRRPRHWVSCIGRILTACWCTGTRLSHC
jgi:Protein of unknown function (DUF3987)